MNAARALRFDLADPFTVCERLGLITPRARRQPRGVLIACPVHGGVSCSVTRGEDGAIAIRVHCFGCDFSADVYGLIAAVYGLDVRREFVDVLLVAAEMAGRSLDDVSPPRFTPRPQFVHERAPTLLPGAERYDEIASWLLDRCPLREQLDVSSYLHQRDILRTQKR